MDSKKYFEKNKCIYGVAQDLSKNTPVSYYIKFTSLSKALKWKDLESKVFPIKELVSKSDMLEMKGYKYEVDECNVYWGAFR